MSDTRLTDADITRIEHEFNYASTRGWISDLILKDARLLFVEIAALRAQLASATATIAEQRWLIEQACDVAQGLIGKLTAAEGREVSYRKALEEIRNIVSLCFPGSTKDRVTAIVTAALATPANGAEEVLMAAEKWCRITRQSMPLQPGETRAAEEELEAAVAAWQKREGETDGEST
ncbi:MAG: hypothetical protein JWQ89_3339 [Devosia sp.]|uniref:hypothetical protein n=1 Tax=Devosia sp. TaxID=1871048 RepID=UPI0026278D03|nr:hypothetical protein [Devosia sp.]MDB5541612.1 hypothetical protein [Devosia sp.]